MATVVHPNFEEITHEVMEDAVKDWVAMGWVVKDSSTPDGVGLVREARRDDLIEEGE
ncbi:hypothetical protein ABZS16_04270 [Trueperella pyogenes]|uniref:hypothetical protein n=1 Tax=Trueperella pyogenes TaxID=1661 RepID=UPI00339DA78A